MEEAYFRRIEGALRLRGRRTGSADEGWGTQERSEEGKGGRDELRRAEDRAWAWSAGWQAKGESKALSAGRRENGLETLARFCSENLGN